MSRLLRFGVLIVSGLSAFKSQAQSPMPQNFVSVTPCRLVDTRTSSGGSGAIPARTYQNFTVAGNCGIPSSASAYSLNVTAEPSGFSLYLSVPPAPSSTPSGPPSSSTLNDPSGTIIANAAVVSARANGAVAVFVSDSSNMILDVDGYFVTESSTSTGKHRSWTGALVASGGANNTAVGFNSLMSASSGYANTATGFQALANDTSGYYNTAIGGDALLSNTSGASNSPSEFRVLRTIRPDSTTPQSGHPLSAKIKPVTRIRLSVFLLSIPTLVE